ncbi:hypothetical protein A3E73_00890 [Candidatus Beckwithbacteria bacterium RIFCSPHIGHO2_12_FULL_47_17]|uniref:Uncharacterized protein n=1 Tax=Candidatus Beckwithbacteria bacterium RIFCSPHIGHO2_12_FULL_47_17 TaxID=1797460 RepID=A0A1F5DM61_9BACT|nr:MAG: hypothetical protein A3E73_00890 [Candidatus Beckwithbacteria bacterium RIFCSPHIGHO2_12_FULL_47_17]
MAGAFSVASAFYRLIIKYESVDLALMAAGFEPDETKSLLQFDQYLKIGALTGSGQQDSDPQIRTIHQVREYLASYLPEEGAGEDDGVKRAGKISHKDHRGRKSTGGTGFDPDE